LGGWGEARVVPISPRVLGNDGNLELHLVLAIGVLDVTLVQPLVGTRGFHKGHGQFVKAPVCHVQVKVLQDGATVAGRPHDYLAPLGQRDRDGRVDLVRRPPGGAVGEATYDVSVRATADAAGSTDDQLEIVWLITIQLYNDNNYNKKIFLTGHNYDQGCAGT